MYTVQLHAQLNPVFTEKKTVTLHNQIQNSEIKMCNSIEYSNKNLSFKYFIFILKLQTFTEINIILIYTMY